MRKINVQQKEKNHGISWINEISLCSKVFHSHFAEKNINISNSKDRTGTIFLKIVDYVKKSKFLFNCFVKTKLRNFGKIRVKFCQKRSENDFFAKTLPKKKRQKKFWPKNHF